MERRFEFGWNVAANAVGGAVVALISIVFCKEYLFGILPVFVGLVVVAAFVAFVGAGLYYFWRLDVVVNPNADAVDRSQYDSFRNDIAKGGTPGKTYAIWLRKGLNHADAFFGDKGRRDISWFNHALRWKSRGPRWTASAFDRCLLLAISYPVAAIFVIWAVFGHVGVAERALGLHTLEDGVTTVRRWVFLTFILLLFLGLVRQRQAQGFPKVAIWWALIVGSGVIVVKAGAGAGALVFPISIAVSVATADVIMGVAAVALVVSIALMGAVMGSRGSGVAVAFAAGIGGFVADSVSRIFGSSIRSARGGIFLGAFVSGLFVVCLLSPSVFAPLSRWRLFGSDILVFGVLTLVNAPFDWIAVGLTRALLRQGLALEGRGPIFYSLLDAAAALALIIVLALACVLAVQTFDDIAILSAGADARILPLAPLFDDLETRPGDPEVWWVWLMLFSTMIPSALNLVIACASLLRGLPPMHRFILARMPAGGTIEPEAKLAVVCMLAAQVATGVLLAGLALYVLGAYVLPLGLPFVGGWIRDMAEQVAAYNAPARLMIWLSGP